MLTILSTGAVFCDLRYRIVPNFLIGLALIVGLVLAGVEGLEVLIKTILLSLVVSYPLYYGFERGWMGGGDVKLVIATSIVAGEELAMTYFLCGTFGGGIVSLTSLVLSRARTSEQKEQIIMVPYAAAYSLGVLLVQMITIIRDLPVP